jgi:hypothetical protein
MILLPYQQSYARIGVVKINEIEANPPGPVTGNQWIELYNMSNEMLDISDWLIKSTRLSKTYVIPSGFIILPNDYTVIPVHHVMFGLESESVVLLTPDSAEVDRTPLLSDTYDDDRTWQRFPNGVDTNTEVDWAFTNSTHGRSNGLPVAKPDFMMSPLLFVDYQGNAIQSFTTGKMAGIRSEILNESAEDKTFVYIVKITDENGDTIFLTWVQDLIVPHNRVVQPTVFWPISIKGNFQVETFVWRSLTLPEPLVPQQSGLLRVAG